MRRWPRRPLRQVLQGSPHRDRVRVVAVVQQQAAAGKRALLLAELRELDPQLALRQRDAEVPGGDSGEAGVRELVAGRVAHRERQRRIGVDALDGDVVAVEVRREQRLVRDDRHAT